MTVLEKILLSLFITSTSYTVVYCCALVITNQVFKWKTYIQFISISTSICSTIIFVDLHFHSPLSMTLKTIGILCVMFVLTKFLFRSGIIITFISTVISFVCLAVGNGFAHILIQNFNVGYGQAKQSFFWLVLTQVVIFLSTAAMIYLIYVFKLFNKLPSQVKAKSIINLSIYLVLTVASIILNFAVFVDKTYRPTQMLPFYLNSVVMILLLIVSIYNTMTFLKLERTTEELQYQIFSNTALQELLDKIRSFKHNYNNFISILDGYSKLDKLSSIKQFIQESTQEIIKTNLYEALVSSNIGDPGLFGLLLNKMNYALDKNISFNLSNPHKDVLDLSVLNVRITHLTEIIGILLDNAIESAAESKYKMVDFAINNHHHYVSLTIRNTSPQRPDMNLIFQKGASSKGENRGLGLWIVNERINKYKHVSLNTSYIEPYFTQELIIEKEFAHKKNAG